MPVNIIDTLKPKNGLDFPVAEAVDVAVEGYSSLADAVTHFATDAMIEAINTVLSGKADVADLTALEAEVDAKADSSALTTAAANLQAQINQIITPVTQDAEVQNARIGEDGTSYVSLKERLDTEYSQIHNDFESVVVVNNMVYNIPDFTMTPEEGSRIHDISTGFDELEVNKTYTFSTVITDVVPSSSDNNNLVFRCVYRDSTYEQIIGTISSGKQAFTFTVQKPVNSFTFIISSSASAGTTLTLTSFKLEIGETASDNLSRYIANDTVARHSANEAKASLSIVNALIPATAALSNKLATHDDVEAVSDTVESIIGINNMAYDIAEFTLQNEDGERDYSILTGFDEPEVNKTYTFSTIITDVVESTTDNKNLVFRCVYRDSTYEQVVGTIKAGKQSFTFTPTDEVYSFYFVISASSSPNTTLTLTEFQLELGETATDNPERYTAVDIVARNLANNNKNGITAVNTKDELLSAIQSGGIVYIESDISTDTMLVLAEDCTIYGNGHTITGDSLSDSLVKVNSGEIIIRDCHFTSSPESVFVFQGTSTVMCYNCEFSRSSGNDGASGKESASGYFYNCKFHDNYDEGISTHGASYCEVIGGEAYRNGFTLDTNTKGAASCFGGVHLGGGRMGKVIGVHSHNNCTYGIALINFQNLTVTDKETCCNNVIENNLSAGIWCTACRDLLLSNNTIVNNGGDAIHFGLDNTYTPTVDLIKSDGYVCGNIIFSNQTDSIVIDPNAESADLHIQN